MKTDKHTHKQSHTHTLAEVDDMEDVRPVSGFRGGDGQGIVIGDMEEMGLCIGDHESRRTGRDN
jgi:hypothetical protein